MPLIFLLAFTLSFYEFGYSFFAGLFVFVLAFVSNFTIGRYMRKVQRVVMKTKDARMKVTTEAINANKMIKMNAWTQNFLDRIYRRRANDIKALKRGGYAVACLISCVYFFPSLLPSVTFSTFIALGNTLDFGVAVASLVLFNLLRGPLISAPIFFGDLIQLMVSMRRI